MLNTNIRSSMIRPFSVLLILTCLLSTTWRSSALVPDPKQPSSLFRIEKVSSRERALDVHVLRGWSVTVGEFAETQQNSISRGEAVKKLTRTLNDDGVIMSTAGDTPLVTFAAIYTGEDGEELPEWITRTNGVVGSVDCQVRKRDVDIGDDNKSSPIPWPHVYRKNLFVDPRMRRMGMALALVRADKSYAYERGVGAIVLDIDPANETGAIQLYLKEGFEFVEEGIMVCPLA